VSIELGFIGVLIVLALSYCGLLLANKFAGFGASPQSLAIVSTITLMVSMIPNIGGIIAIITQYIMLKKIKPEGAVIFTMLISIITTVLVVIFAFKMFSDMFTS